MRKEKGEGLNPRFKISASPSRLLRDEDHARGFLERHQNKLIYGSDCSDPDGHGDRCSGAKQIETIRRLSPHPSVTRKIFWENGARVLKIKP